MKWNHKFNIKDDWQKAVNREVSVADFSKLLANKISKSPFYNEEDIEIADIVLEFTHMGESNWDDFDVVWDQFYDWADTNRVWIQTF